MGWNQLVFISGADQADALAERLELADAAAVTLQDAADQALFDVGQESITLWDQTRIVALFDDQIDLEMIVSLLKSHGPLPPHEVVPLKEQDWERAWMSRFKPMQFGPRVWVCPSWETPPDPDAVNLILDPGMAFGTGTHETTAMCLRWLANTPLDLHEHCVIDYGCGSGILAIAAAKLGAQPVYAVDIEQQALDSTAENAQTNSVSEHLHIAGPDDFNQQWASQTQSADVLIANILANPLISLAPRFAALTQANSTLVLSGILREQAEAVLAAYAAYFSFLEPVYENEWVLLAGTRKST